MQNMMKGNESEVMARKLKADVLSWVAGSFASRSTPPGTILLPFHDFRNTLNASVGRSKQSGSTLLGLRKNDFT
jgi:hypothetical protein